MAGLKPRVPTGPDPTPRSPAYSSDTVGLPVCKAKHQGASPVGRRQGGSRGQCRASGSTAPIPLARASPRPPHFSLGPRTQGWAAAGFSVPTRPASLPRDVILSPHPHGRSFCRSAVTDELCELAASQPGPWPAQLGEPPGLERHSSLFLASDGFCSWVHRLKCPELAPMQLGALTSHIHVTFHSKPQHGALGPCPRLRKGQGTVTAHAPLSSRPGPHVLFSCTWITQSQSKKPWFC